MSKIELLHGSDHVIEKPELSAGKIKNDYGRGFYCTEDLSMAMEWVCKNNTDGFVNKYDFDLESLKVLNLLDGDYNILHWMALLLKNRTFRLSNEIALDAREYIIDNFSIDAIINVGSAGAANDELDIGDIVIGDKLVQHDFDITAFGHPKGYISNVGQFVESDRQLIEKMQKTIAKVREDEVKIKIGTIASGDIFCTSIEMKEKIRNKFNADAIEMEGAAIAQVCQLGNIPFIIVRSISDSPNGNNNVTFDKFLEIASNRCAKIIKEFLN